MLLKYLAPALSTALLGPLLEHLLDRLLHHLLILVAIVIQRILRDSAPNQRFALRVIEIHDHGSLNVLFWSNPTHSTANPAHAPGTIRSLLSQAPVGGQDQVWILVFLHQLQALRLHCAVDILLRYLGQNRVLNLVLIL